MQMIRDGLAEKREDVFDESKVEPVWTQAALKRLSAAPSFVQAMVRKLYTDYARSQGYKEITPAVMNEARDALGMKGI